MTQEENQLLLKDLCARLPYGVKVQVYGDEQLYGPAILEKIDVKKKVAVFNFAVPVEEVKPYLRPLTTMTEEELSEFILISDTVLWLGDKRSTCILSLEQMDWFNAHHFDYRGLIEKGLALEAPEGMYIRK